MSFFKEAFTKPSSETMSNFYINQRNQDQDEVIQDENRSMTGSILKSRRMSGKKIPTKASDPPKLRGVQSTIGMSCDIKSLIQEFHQDNSNLK